MSYPSPLLAGLGSIVEEAGSLAQQIRRAGFEREIKPDGSIVTPADVAVEKLLRKTLPEIYPDTNVWGEELGFEPEGEGGLWLVDPIDGTSNFAFGAPGWGVSVALLRENQLELAAVVLPDLHETYLAERGRGSFCNGTPMAPIPAGPIRPEELVSYDDRIPRMFPKSSLPGKMRCSGAFVIEGTFAARQRWRGMVGMNEKLYDVAACVLIAQELGADIRYADGDPFVVGDLVKDAKIDRPWLIFPPESGFYLPAGDF